VADTQTYNGWTNYETWGVALILDNDYGTYMLVQETARDIRNNAVLDDNVRSGIWTVYEAAKFRLADWLKDFTETLCGIGSESEDLGIPEPSMMASQLLGGAISDVDFDSIADHYLTDMEDDEDGE
jgi:hypothetical protein